MHSSQGEHVIFKRCVLNLRLLVSAALQILIFESFIFPHKCHSLWSKSMSRISINFYVEKDWTYCKCSSLCSWGALATCIHQIDTWDLATSVERGCTPAYQPTSCQLRSAWFSGSQVCKSVYLLHASSVERSCTDAASCVNLCSQCIVPVRC